MTIKEAEGRTGLARANIRYYEDQGFFSPARGENGYRDYSGRDVEILLKVKLLRQLGFSLEDIRALQRGDQTLETALARREEELDREQQELDRAARLCRALREDGADFATLDAGRWLDRLGQGEGAAALEEDQDPKRWLSLRRYSGRMLDYLVWLTLGNLFVVIGGRLGLFQSAGVAYRMGVVPLVPMFLSETLLLHRTGITLGKKLMCIQLVGEDGRFLSLGQATRRTLLITLLMAAYIVAVYGMFGDFFKGATRTALLIFFAGTWRFGDEVSEQLERYFFCWQRRGEVYLDTTTGEEPLLSRKEMKWGLAGAALTVLLCFGVISLVILQESV